MQDIILDFETYYDDDYSLKKMENAEYVMDPRFEVIGVSIKRPGQPTTWHTGTHEEIAGVLARIDWATTRLVSHNARFDGAILEWRFGLKPAAYLCTMVGSRPFFTPYCKSQGLANVAEYLGLGTKGDYVHKVSGMHRLDFDKYQIEDYGTYCATDSDLSDGIRQRLMAIMPAEEFDVIDLTLKKYLRPRIELDVTRLEHRLKSIDAERDRRIQGLADIGLTIKDITSRTKFAEHLRVAMGSSGSVPMKINKDGKLTYAFAKDDVEFKALLAHPDPKVRYLVESKTALSSTLERSRVEKLIHLARVMGGVLPVPLVYYGAHTGRLSGDGGINLQNLPRVTYSKAKELLKGHLRYALCAPEGYEVVAADLSNIEARIVAAISGQHDLVEAFKNGFDVYSDFASKIYGYAVNKKDHPLERFVGKTCILGLGYGMGWKKFQLKMAQEGIVMSEAEAKRVVRLYRDTYDKIPKFWAALEYAMIQYSTKPSGMGTGPAGLTFLHERIVLPNGMPIIYPGLRAGPAGIKFDHRYAASEAQSAVKEATADAKRQVNQQEKSNIWGGAFTENVAQALARIILTNAELTLAKIGITTVLQVHDELVFLIPKILVDKVIPVIEKVLTKPVAWLPNLPIACEIGHGPTYGDAK
jgi:DNA polymerase family A